MINNSPYNYAKLPLAKRLRGYFFYSPTGDRYLDLFMHNASLIYGHNPQNFTLSFKNPLEQGLLCPYPNIWQIRLEKALHKKFNNFKTINLINSSNPIAHILLSQAVESWQKGNLKLIRPHSDSNLALVNHAILILPVVSNFIIELKRDININQEPFIIDAPNARTALRYINRINEDSEAKNRSSYVFDKFSNLWQRHGIYLESKLNESSYNKFFDYMLKNNIIIAPHNKSLSLVPSRLSKGLEQNLINIMHNFTDS